MGDRRRIVSQPENAIYGKIRGLEQLEELGFPVPPYQILDVSGDKPSELESYLLKKIELANVPNKPGDMVGVTIRVSMPGSLDKSAHHGGLHVTKQNEVLREVLAKYHQYGSKSKIIIQHTVDARCSGTILKEGNCFVIETIFGDAPPLLEGRKTNFEKWTFSMSSGKWKLEWANVIDGDAKPILTREDLRILERYVKISPEDVYLEWSISKNGEVFFYEYHKFQNPA
jgi:hypothetical protein